MIEYQLLIKELPDGSVGFQRRSKPAMATPHEIAAAQHIKQELDGMIARMMQAAGGGTSVRKGPTQSLSVQSQWQDYLTTVFKTPIGEAQRSEMQKAFYAGAVAMLQTVGRASTDYDEDTACAYLEQLNAEIELFYQSLK